MFTYSYITINQDVSPASVTEKVFNDLNITITNATFNALNGEFSWISSNDISTANVSNIETIIDNNIDGIGGDNHSNLTLDDGTNPHGTTKSDVGLDNVDNVKQYPNTNPDGFETPSELDIRDTNNRDRSNHTGTQSASTIFDFDIEVENNTQVSQNVTHRGLTSNPHNVTKSQVGLENVDNTSDLNKPVSTSTQTSLDDKVDKILGKGLSDENYTLNEKIKLGKILGKIVTIISKQDFIDISISYTNGIIEIPGNLTYRVLNIIDLGSDRIVVSNSTSVAFRGSNNSVITATGLANTDYMITLVDTTTIFSNITLVSNNSKTFYFNNISKEYSLYIINSVGNNGRFGDVDNAKSLIITDSIFRNYNNLLIGNIDLIVFDNTLFEFNGYLTEINGGIIPLFRISNNIFKVVNFTGNDYTILNTDITNISHIIIDLNQFIDFTNYPLSNGVNAKNDKFIIPPGTNLNLPGFYQDNLTAVLDEFETNSTSWGLIPQTLSLASIDSYEEGATIIQGSLRVTVSSDINGGGIDVGLYSMTDGAFVTGSILNITITTANVYQIGETPLFDIDASKEYRVVIRRSGPSGGNPSSFIRSAILQLEVY